MRSLLGISVTGLLVLGSMASLAQSQNVLSFTIDDTHISGGGAGVFSDSSTTGTNLYQDYRVDTSGTYLNWCVDAEPANAGNLFVRLNRKLDGDAGVMRCTDNPRPDSNPGVQRNFTLRINNDAACDILADPNAGLPLTDSAGAPWDTNLSATPCSLAHNDNPRIRLGTLYKAKSRTTPVDFLTVTFGSPNSYEIRSDAAASITSSGAGHKAVAYGGTYRLVKFEPGQKARAVGPSFPMPVRMDFYQQ